MQTIKCDKCGKDIEPGRYIKSVGDYLTTGKVDVRNDCHATFEFTRICKDCQCITHRCTVDLCPECQEAILKDILGELPWEEGK